MVFVAVVSYFWGMHSAGYSALSGDSKDWGDFGSYLSGILLPASVLLGGYHVYKTFVFSSYYQKLTLIRESLTRLDDEFTNKLSSPFKNNCFGDIYYGRELKEVIIALSNKKMESTPEMQQAILSLLHNFAIHCESFRYYIALLKKYPTGANETKWLGNLERAYWVERYSTICKRMIDIVGEENLTKKCTKEQFSSFKFICGIE